MESEYTELSLQWGAYAGELIFELFLSILPWLMLLGMLGLVSSVIISIIIRRKGWFRRQNRNWNIFTKFFYVVIILGFTLTGTLLGGIYGTQRTINSRIDEDLVPSLEKNLPNIHQYLTTEIENNSKAFSSISDIVHSVLSMLYYQPESNSWFAKTKARCINWVTLNSGKWLLTAGFTAVMAWLIGRSGDDIGLSKDSINMALDIIKEMDLSKVDNTIVSIVADVFQSKIDIFFKSIYLQIIGILLLVLIIIAVETIWYHFCIKR